MEKELFDEMYQVESHHWWFVARRKIIISVIEKLNLENNARIFDAGCGNGDNLSLLANYGQVTAMERDDNALAYAKNRGIGKIYQGELPNTVPDEIDNNFDLIVMLDVLEHIDDDNMSLQVLHEHVKDNGVLLITVPAYQFLWGYHDEVHHHKRRYNVSRMKNLLKQTGWKITYISYFNTLLFPLAFIIRIKQKIFPSTNEEVIKVPNKWLNILFEKIFSLECHLIRHFPLPFGLSIIVLSEKI